MKIERVRVIGPGGVGGYYGGKLAAKGDAAVDFVARGAHGRAMAEEGLRVRSYQGDFAVRVRVHETVPADGAADLALVCVKDRDLDAIVPSLAATLAPGGVVLPLLNGLDAEARIAAVVGHDRVLGGIAFIGAGVAGPGVIEHRSRGSIGVGELEGEPGERVDAICKLFEAAGVEVRPLADLKQAKWIKLAWNNAFNPPTALTGLLVGPLLRVPELAALARTLIEEVYAVAEAEGVAVPPGLADLYIHGLPDLEEVETSMLQDMKAGRPLEADAITGALVRLADAHGVPVPANRAIYALLKGINAARGV